MLLFTYFFVNNPCLPVVCIGLFCIGELVRRTDVVRLVVVGVVRAFSRAWPFVDELDRPD